jgi:hypothetical protein
MNFLNPDYDEQVMQRIAEESETFRCLLQGLVDDTGNQYPTNQAWLGTLSLGENKVCTQVKLVVTQETVNLIDEVD